MARLHSNENGHNGQETRGACPEEEDDEEKLLQRISNTACFATKGREGGNRRWRGSRQEARAGSGPPPPLQLSLQQDRKVAVAVAEGRRRVGARQLRERRSF